MRNIHRIVTTAVSVMTVAGLLSTVAVTAHADGHGKSAVEKGKKLAFDRKKGNCLACHQIEGGELAGNIGPPLIAMKARFPDVAKLRAQIADPTKANPNTIMPPFGPHAVMSDEEIDLVVEFVQTL